MPIENFQGDTFVAFTDISGFKILMKIWLFLYIPQSP